MSRINDFLSEAGVFFLRRRADGNNRRQPVLGRGIHLQSGDVMQYSYCVHIPDKNAGYNDTENRKGGFQP